MDCRTDRSFRVIILVGATGRNPGGRDRPCFFWGPFAALALLATGLFPVAAREVFQTHAQVLREAPIIVHARVDSFHPVGGVGQLYEFQLTRLEEIRGRVPASFRVRIAVQSRVVDPDGVPDPPGSQWVLLLDSRPAPEGYYLLNSLTYGKIELTLRRDAEDLILTRAFPAAEGGGLKYYSLREFRELVRRIGVRRK